MKIEKSFGQTNNSLDHKKKHFVSEMAEDSENGRNGLTPGYTKPALDPKKKRCSASKYWCFTLHNWTQHDVDKMVETFQLYDIKYLFADEVGKSGEKPHLQGYLKSSTTIRWSVFRLNKAIHWEKRRGTRAQNITYCTKEGRHWWTNMKLPKPIWKPELYGWQLEIKEKYFDQEPLHRKIIWVWSESGSRGKSSMVRHMALNGALICGGKASDMKYMIIKYHEKHGDYPEHVVFDTPRSTEKFLSYQGIEEIKNGVFASTKYECEMVVMNQPNVYVFANFAPDLDNEHMSSDRLIVLNVENYEQ